MSQQARKILRCRTGCLLSPKKDFVLCFIKEPKTLRMIPIVITQLWYATQEGIPKTLKNTRKVDYQCAKETWEELLSNGWQSVEFQSN